MMTVSLSAFLMDRAEHLELVRALTRELKAAGTTVTDDRPPVFVAGGMCRSSEFIQLIEESGCYVSGDDLCTGYRAFDFQEEKGDTPLEELARIYLARTPCPAFHQAGRNPGDTLVASVKRDNARGVVFLLTSFCDPVAFDHVPMMQALEKAGIPALTLSVEQHRDPPEQLRTRVQAFAEMLQENTAS